jgi:hypothetical protein
MAVPALFGLNLLAMVEANNSVYREHKAKDERQIIEFLVRIFGTILQSKEKTTCVTNPFILNFSLRTANG